MKRKIKCRTPGQYSTGCECAYCRRKLRRILASWSVSNLRRAVRRARNFPVNTCPSSRFLVTLADQLTDKKRKHGVEEIWGAEHIAQSLYVTVAALWKARSALKAAR